MYRNPILIAALLTCMFGGNSHAFNKHDIPPNVIPGARIIPSTQITCDQGESMLRHRGFRRVEIVDCNALAFRYNVFALSRWYQIDVSRRGVLGRPIPIAH